MALIKWVHDVAKDPTEFTQDVWNIVALGAASLGDPQKAAMVRILAPLTISGRNELLLMPRNFFVWQVYR